MPKVGSDKQLLKESISNFSRLHIIIFLDEDERVCSRKGVTFPTPFPRGNGKDVSNTPSPLTFIKEKKKKKKKKITLYF